MDIFKITLIAFIVSLLIAFNFPEGKNESQDDVFPTTAIKELDAELMENSGLVYWDNLLWTINDSGGKNEVYGFDPYTGAIRRTLLLANAANHDWEDIAQDDHYLYVGDCGNNFGNRKNLQILKIKKEEITKEKFQVLNAEVIHFRYAEQINFKGRNKKNRFDCEAFFALNDSLYLFSKDWVTNITRVYVMPTTAGDYSLAAIDSFDTKGLITGADLRSDGKLALIGYYDYKSFGWIFQKTDNTLFSSSQFIDLSMLENAQTEGVCFTPDGDLLFSCEKTANYNQKVWIIPADEL